MLASDFKH